MDAQLICRKHSYGEDSEISDGDYYVKKCRKHSYDEDSEISDGDYYAKKRRKHSYEEDSESSDDSDYYANKCERIVDGPANVAITGRMKNETRFTLQSFMWDTLLKLQNKWSSDEPSDKEIVTKYYNYIANEMCTTFINKGNSDLAIIVFAESGLCLDFKDINVRYMLRRVHEIFTSKNVPNINYVYAAIQYRLFHIYLIQHKLGKAWKCIEIAEHNLQHACGNTWTAEVHEMKGLYFEMTAIKQPHNEHLLKRAFEQYQLARQHCLLHIIEGNASPHYRARVHLLNMAITTLKMPTHYALIISASSMLRDILQDCIFKWQVTEQEWKKAEGLLQQAEQDAKATTSSEFDRIGSYTTFYICLAEIYLYVRRTQLDIGKHEYTQAQNDLQQIRQRLNVLEKRYGDIERFSIKKAGNVVLNMAVITNDIQQLLDRVESSIMIMQLAKAFHTNTPEPLLEKSALEFTSEESPNNSTQEDTSELVQRKSSRSSDSEYPRNYGSTGNASSGDESTDSSLAKLTERKVFVDSDDLD